MNKLFYSLVFLVSMYSTSIIGDFEVFHCGLKSLESYGFEQVSKDKEYVCTSPFDHASFIIVEDKQNNLSLNDNLRTILKNNDVIAIEVVEHEL